MRFKDFLNEYRYIDLSKKRDLNMLRNRADKMGFELDFIKDKDKLSFIDIWVYQKGEDSEPDATIKTDGQTFQLRSLVKPSDTGYAGQGLSGFEDVLKKIKNS